MRENVRRQRQTIKILLQFALSYPNLRDAAQLGLSEDGQVFWREHYLERTTLSAELKAAGEQLSHCLNSVGAKAQQKMVAVLRKYPNDPEIIAAAKALHEMWAENDHSLLDVLR